MKRILLAILFITAVVFGHTIAMAAGTPHVALNTKVGPSRTIIWDWTSDGSGDVSGSLGYAITHGGTCFSAILVPLAGVSDYLDITITATFPITIADGTTRTVTIADILDGAGANLSNSTNGTLIQFSTQYTLPYWTQLELKVANAGASKQGTFILNIWEERIK